MLLWMDDIDMWNVECNNSYDDHCARGSIAILVFFCLRKSFQSSNIRSKTKIQYYWKTFD